MPKSTKWKEQEEKFDLLMRALQFKLVKQLAYAFKINNTTAGRWINGYNSPAAVTFISTIQGWLGREIDIDVVNCSADDFKVKICDPLNGIDVHNINNKMRSRIGEHLSCPGLTDERLKKLDGQKFLYMQPIINPEAKSNDDYSFLTIPLVVAETHDKYLILNMKNRIGSQDTALVIPYYDAWSLIFLDAAGLRPPRYTLLEAPKNEERFFFGTTVSIDRYNEPHNVIYGAQVLLSPANVYLENFTYPHEYVVAREKEFGKKLDEFFRIGIDNVNGKAENRYTFKCRLQQIDKAKNILELLSEEDCAKKYLNIDPDPDETPQD